MSLKEPHMNKQGNIIIALFVHVCQETC